MATTDSDKAKGQDALAAAEELLRDVADMLRRDPRLDPDTVRHVLTLLRLDPLTRLNRSLFRGARDTKLNRDIAIRDAHRSPRVRR